MIWDAKNILQQALSLGANDRADLAARLIESLESRFDENVEAEWDAEISRRVRDLDAGKTKTVQWSEVRRRLMGRLNDAAA